MTIKEENIEKMTVVESERERERQRVGMRKWRVMNDMVVTVFTYADDFSYNYRHKVQSWLLFEVTVGKNHNFCWRFIHHPLGYRHEIYIFLF